MIYDYEKEIQLTKQQEQNFNKFIMPSIKEAIDIFKDGNFKREHFKNIVLFILKIKCNEL